MELTTFLSREGWTAGEEFGISLEYKGETVPVSVTEFRDSRDSVYVATLVSGREVLLIPHRLSQHEDAVKWLPVDVENIDLAAVIGEGIERCERPS